MDHGHVVLKDEAVNENVKSRSGFLRVAMLHGLAKQAAQGIVNSFVHPPKIGFQNCILVMQCLVGVEYLSK